MIRTASGTRKADNPSTVRLNSRRSTACCSNARNNHPKVAAAQKEPMTQKPPAATPRKAATVGQTARRGLDLRHQGGNTLGKTGIKNQPDQERRGQSLDGPEPEPSAQIHRLRFWQPLPQIGSRHPNPGEDQNDAKESHLGIYDTRFPMEAHLLF